LAEFRRYLAIAEASCAEVHSRLYVALDVEHLQQSGFDALTARTEEVTRLIDGLRALLDSRRAATLNNRSPTHRT
jgi:four helix bundle protein